MVGRHFQCVGPLAMVAAGLLLWRCVVSEDRGRASDDAITQPCKAGSESCTSCRLTLEWHVANSRGPSLKYMSYDMLLRAIRDKQKRA